MHAVVVCECMLWWCVSHAVVLCEHMSGVVSAYCGGV